MAPKGLSLVKVDTLSGALTALEDLGTPKQSSIPTC
jgi:hypothetical protein